MKRKYTKKSKPKYKKLKPNSVPNDVFMLMAQLMRASLMMDDDETDAENSELDAALNKLQSKTSFNNSFTLNREKVKTDNMPDEVLTDLMKHSGSLFNASDPTLMALNQQYQLTQKEEDMANAYLRFIRSNSPTKILLSSFIMSQKQHTLGSYALNPDVMMSEFKKSVNRIYPNLQIEDPRRIMSTIGSQGYNIHEVVTKYLMSLMHRTPNDMQRSMIIMNLMNGVIAHKLPVITLGSFVGELEKSYDNPTLHGYYVDFLKEYNPDSLKIELFDALKREAPQLDQQIAGLTDSLVHEVQKHRYAEGDPGTAMPYDYTNALQMYKQLIRGTSANAERNMLKQYGHKIPSHALESALVESINSIDSGAKSHIIRAAVHADQAMRIFSNAASVFRGNEEYERILHKVFHIKHVEPIHHYNSDSHMRGYKYMFGKKFLEDRYTEVFVDKDIHIKTGPVDHKPEYQFDPQSATMTPIQQQSTIDYLSKYFGLEEE